MNTFSLPQPSPGPVCDVEVRLAVKLPSSAYEFLRARILSGELPPHTRLKEEEVAGQLSISRTPVREALARLESEGLVKRTPRRGAVVSKVEIDEVDEIYEIRAALETLVAKRACERATDAEIEEMRQSLMRAQACMEAGEIDSILLHTVHFHQVFNLSSRSPRLIGLLRSLEDRLVPFRHAGIRRTGRPETIMRQHWGILEGLRHRDLEEMLRWIDEHAEQGRLTAIQNHLEAGRSRRMPAQAVLGNRV